MSIHNPQNNFEALRLQSPEFLTNHRQSIIANAVRNLEVHAPAEALVAKDVAPQTVELDINPPTNVPEMTTVSAQFKQDTSIDRIMQNVDAIYEGQGNPLYDKETF